MRSIGGSMVDRSPFRFALGVALVLVMFIGASAAQQPATPNPYKSVENWAKLPPGIQWGQVSGVEFDSHGNLWVIHRTDPPIMAFDPQGKFLKSFGDGMFVQ